MSVSLARTPIATQNAIKAYLESGYSLRKISKLAGCSVETVIAVKRRNSLDPDDVDRIKQQIAGKFYKCADSALENIDQAKYDKASALQLGTLAAISVDKARLVEGKATARVEFKDSGDEALESEIARLEETIRASAIDVTAEASPTQGVALTPVSDGGQP